MRFLIVDHARKRMVKRGASEEEVKKVLEVFVEEAGEVVVVTVYVYYCSWEGAR